MPVWVRQVKLLANVFLNDGEGSTTIKLADPKLVEYSNYPELTLVNTQFFVNPNKILEMK